MKSNLIKVVLSSEEGKLGILAQRGDGSFILEGKTPQLEKELLRIIEEIKARPVSVNNSQEAHAKELYKDIIERIVREIKYIIADVAITQANLIDGLVVSQGCSIIKLEREPTGVLEELIDRYEKIVGPIAIRLAKRAVQPVLVTEKGLRLPKKLEE